MCTSSAVLNRKILQLVAAAGAAIACASVEGSVLTWANPAGGSAGTAANWNPAQVPAAADVLNFGLGATYSITYPAGVAQTAQQNYDAGVVSITYGAPHTLSGQFVVGLNNNSVATVNMNGGTLTTNGIVSVGTTGGTAVLNLTSPTSFMTSSGTLGLRVGNSGNGTVNVLAGAGIDLTGGPVTVAAISGSAGALEVSGVTGGQASTVRALHPTNGDVMVAISGPGTLTVDGGGQVVAADDFTVAPFAPQVGVATVRSATASTSTLTALDVFIASNANALAGGTGTLNVGAGGRVTTTNTTLGDINGGSGTLNITGGLYATRTLTIDPSSGHLNQTGGELRITTGGSFSPAVSTLLDNPNPATPEILHYQGSTGTLVGGFRIGDFGAGTLLVDSGAVVNAAPAAIGVTETQIGLSSNAVGAVTVVGAGSTLSFASLVGFFGVGQHGTGHVSVSSGGRLECNVLSAGFGAGGHGDVRITGAGSMIANIVQIGSGAGIGELSLGSSSTLDCRSFSLAFGSALAIDDSVLTVADPFAVATATIGGSMSIGNAGELSADAVSIAGTVLGNGNIYGDVTIQPGGSVTAAGGVLFIGSPGNGNNGFVNQGTLNVGAAQVFIQDGNGSPAGDITIAGGQLAATGLTFSSGDSLSGHGGISSPITATGATFAADDATGIVFNSPVNADETNAWSGTKFTFAAGGDFAGRGTIPSMVASEEEASITATGALTLGNNNISGAVALNGPLYVGSNTVALRSNSNAILGVFTTINGGTLSGPASNARNIHSNGFPPVIPPSDRTVFDSVPIELGAFDVLEGTGTISGRLKTLANSAVTATGPLTLAGSEFPDFDFGNFDDGRTFVDWSGGLNVGPHTVTFTGVGHLFGDSSITTITGGLITSRQLGLRGTLTGTGSLVVTDTVNPANITNGGIIRPGGAGTGELVLTGNFSNQNSATFSAVPGTLEMDISGDQGFAHDSIRITEGDATLTGTLNVHILDAEPAPGTVYTLLRCENGTVAGEFATVNLPVLSFGGSLQVRYTANTVQIVVRPACVADFNNDGELNPDDLADFIGAFFSQPPGDGSDFNADGATDPDDLADFIGAFFQGCS